MCLIEFNFYGVSLMLIPDVMLFMCTDTQSEMSHLVIPLVKVFFCFGMSQKNQNQTIIYFLLKTLLLMVLLKHHFPIYGYMVE